MKPYKFANQVKINAIPVRHVLSFSNECTRSIFSDLTVRVRVSVTGIGIVLSVTDGVVGISGNVGENKSSYNRC